MSVVMSVFTYLNVSLTEWRRGEHPQYVSCSTQYVYIQDLINLTLVRGPSEAHGDCREKSTVQASFVTLVILRAWIIYKICKEKKERKKEERKLQVLTSANSCPVTRDRQPTRCRTSHHVGAGLNHHQSKLLKHASMH